ncbi:MAG TPA: hypothetical protein VHY19_10135 [Steroidobacteraceae bacterium]|jgi:hypothetical protein|nr:hypothetical protein [Steroidobacteraceae bacterium]
MTRLPSLLGGALVAGLTLATLSLLLGSAPARADVTIQQKTTMNLAGMNIDVTDTERTSLDKQRSDSTMQCHGLLALVCRNAQSAEIRRLDKQLEWDLQPKKQLCTERVFPTPEQRAKAQLAFEDDMAQLKACPMPQQSAQKGPDTSHCQMSAAKVDVQQSGQHQTLIGHDAHRSTVTLSQTCTDPQTGYVCQFDYGFDLWLTPDDLPGMAERRDFAAKYATAQGLDPNNPQLRGMMQQYMAPYADTLKQLQTQGSALQGNPLRTTFFLDYGGPQCGDAQQQQQLQQQQQVQQQPARRRGGLFGSIASSAVSGGVSGLFHHSVSIPTGSVGGQVASNAANQTADAASSAAADATANGVANASAAHAQDTTAASAVSVPMSPTPPGMVRMMSFTTEVTSVDTTSIDASLFDLPAGYRVQQQPPPPKTKQPVCPANNH